jgi:hypothetical protein
LKAKAKEYEEETQVKHGELVKFKETSLSMFRDVLKATAYPREDDFLRYLKSIS